MKNIVCLIFLLLLVSCKKDIKEELLIEWVGSLVIEVKSRRVDSEGSFVLYKILVKNTTKDTFILFIQNPELIKERKRQSFFLIQNNMGNTFLDSLQIVNNWEYHEPPYISIKPKDSTYIISHDLKLIGFDVPKLTEEIKTVFEKGEMYYNPKITQEYKSTFPKHYRLLDSLVLIPRSHNYRYAFQLEDEYLDTGWFSGFNSDLSFFSRIIYNINKILEFDKKKKKRLLP